MLPAAIKSRTHARRGLSLPETLISLAISSGLLVAIAAAFNASAKAVSDNDKFATATQGARVALRQLLTEIRRCDAVNVYSDHLDLIRPLDATLKDSRAANEINRTFTYDATAATLTLTIHYSGGQNSPAYVIARNVSADAGGPFSYEAVAGQPGATARVSVTLVCKIGNDQIRLSGSAAVRRNTVYSS